MNDNFQILLEIPTTTIRSYMFSGVILRKLDQTEGEFGGDSHF